MQTTPIGQSTNPDNRTMPPIPPHVTAVTPRTLTSPRHATGPIRIITHKNASNGAPIKMPIKIDSAMRPPKQIVKRLVNISYFNIFVNRSFHYCFLNNKKQPSRTVFFILRYFIRLLCLPIFRRSRYSIDLYSQVGLDSSYLRHRSSHH